MTEERRITDRPCWDASLVLALIYTILYMMIVMSLIFVEIPKTNEKTIDMLIGIMSAIQLAIVNKYFGGSKSADDAQNIIAQSKERTDTVLREVVSSALPPAKI